MSSYPFFLEEEGDGYVYFPYPHLSPSLYPILTWRKMGTVPSLPPDRPTDRPTQAPPLMAPAPLPHFPSLHCNYLAVAQNDLGPFLRDVE